MLLKILIIIIFFFSFTLNIQADEKQLIIDKLIQTKNFTFNFEQITNKGVEAGYCLFVFDNKLKCKYEGKLQKEIIVNNKTLVVLKKKYNKIYFYPISKSLFSNILNKNNLIKVIQESVLTVNNNIELVYLDKKNKKIKIFFGINNYELMGWLIEDKLQNEIFFSLKIDSTNTEIDVKNFKIPTVN